jgi:hypothetical protein
MTLEAYNGQYLQRHSDNASAVLGAARGLQILGSPRDEIEGVVLGTLNPEVDLSLKVSNVLIVARVKLNILHRQHWTCGHS